MDELSDIRGRGDVREGSRTLSLHADEFAGVERAIESGYDRWVGAAVTDDDGRVLFVENGWIVSGGDREIRRVSKPAGNDRRETIEPAETLEEAAVREVAEETGVAIELDRPLAVERQTFAHDGDDVSGWFVLVGGRAAEPTISDDLGVDGETIRDARWFAELPETPYRDDIESFRD